MEIGDIHICPVSVDIQLMERCRIDVPYAEYREISSRSFRRKSKGNNTRNGEMLRDMGGMVKII
jgi:hypothetical protein